MTEIEVKYLDKILIRNKIIEVGSKLYIPHGKWKGYHEVKDIQLHNNTPLIWCIVNKQLICFNEDEIFNR